MHPKMIKRWNKSRKKIKRLPFLKVKFCRKLMNRAMKIISFKKMIPLKIEQFGSHREQTGVTYKEKRHRN